MSTILVTGGAGFIGSNFVLHMLSAYDDVRIVTYDALTYAGNLENIASVLESPRHVFVRISGISRRYATCFLATVSIAL